MKFELESIIPRKFNQGKFAEWSLEGGEACGAHKHPAAVAAERGPGLLRGHQRHGGHGPAEAGEAHEKEGARAAG